MTEYSLDDLSMSAQERREFDLRAARDAAVARAEAAADWLKRLEVWLTEQADNEDMSDDYTDAMSDARRQVQSIRRALDGTP